MQCQHTQDNRERRLEDQAIEDLRSLNAWYIHPQMRLYRVSRIIHSQNTWLDILAPSAPKALVIANDIKACREGDRKQRARWNCP